MFTQERPRTSEKHFQNCSCVPDRIAIWWCWFLRRGENRSPRGKTSHLLEPEREPTTRSCTCTVNDTSAYWLHTVTEMLIHSHETSTFFDLQLLLVAQLWDTTLTPSHPTIQSCSSNFWACLYCYQPLPRGEGGAQTQDHGTVSQLFLNSLKL